MRDFQTFISNRSISIKKKIEEIKQEITKGQSFGSKREDGKNPFLIRAILPIGPYFS